MPGIFGIISQNTKYEEMDNHLQLMLEPMLHEPFYNSGIYSNRDFGVNIGWVCHENSFCDCMPIWNEKKDIVLFFMVKIILILICLITSRHATITSAGIMQATLFIYMRNTVPLF
jgi:hypothetical protein